MIAAVALVVAIGAATYAVAGDGGDGREKPKQHEKQGREQPWHDTRDDGGPPPSAPAPGPRGKDARQAPGSQAFKNCIKARKR